MEQKTAAEDGVLTVEMFHRGNSVHLPVKTVTIQDEERIEDLYPEPAIPMMTLPGGQKIPDLTNEEYLRKAKRMERQRDLARVALALLPGHPVTDGWTGGEESLEQKIQKMRQRMQLWEVVHLAKVIRVPRVMTEADVQEEMQKIYPTSKTAMVTSAD